MFSVVGPLRIVHLALSVGYVIALSGEVERKMCQRRRCVKVMSYLTHDAKWGEKLPIKRVGLCFKLYRLLSGTVSLLSRTVIRKSNYPRVDLNAVFNGGEVIFYCLGQ